MPCETYTCICVAIIGEPAEAGGMYHVHDKLYTFETM
jgi:hypothetical protein